MLDLIPNGNERARAKEQLEADIMRAANNAMVAQLEINRQEAAHRSIFVAGWRPWIGWVCGMGIAWAFIGHLVANWALVVFDTGVTTLPDLELDYLFELVLAMLGMGGLRTFENLKGVAREK